jgi:Flp pilus assembly protein TadD
MKKSITILLFLLLSSLLFISVVSAKEYTPQFETEAEALKELGLFYGTEKGFELNRQPTRLEALLMLLRLLGLEQEAETETATIPFKDVSDWWKPYVAYAYKNKLTMGMEETVFGSDVNASEQMFVTFVLRSLGYSDANESNADFTYDEAVEKAKELGLLTDLYLQNKPEELMRDGCVAISTQALKTNLKEKNEILLSKLIDRGVVAETKAKKLLSEAENFALLAEKAYQKRQVSQAEAYYLKAIALEPLKAKYQAGLAEIYQWMARTSKTASEQDAWNVKQRTAAELAVNLSPQNSDYVKYLMILYFDLGENEKALIQAETYLTLSKKREEAYEWLARGYNELGIELIQEGEVLEGKDLLNKSIELLNIKSLANNKTIMFYAGKSYLAYGDYTKAETLLQTARSVQDLRSHSDRLLFLINEETGKSTENKKYTGVIWMTYVTSTPEYLEMKSILNNKILT